MPIFLRKRLKKTLLQDPAKAETWWLLNRARRFRMQDWLGPSRLTNTVPDRIPGVVTTEHRTRQLVVQRVAGHVPYKLAEDGTPQ